MDEYADSQVKLIISGKSKTEAFYDLFHPLEMIELNYFTFTNAHDFIGQFVAGDLSARHGDLAYCFSSTKHTIVGGF